LSVSIFSSEISPFVVVLSLSKAISRKKSEVIPIIAMSYKIIAKIPAAASII
jgi:hypothetical protein